MVTVGLIEIEELLEPVFQLYVAAPLAVKTAVLPLQNKVLLETAVTLGEGLTVMVQMAVSVQPSILIPVIVYVLVTVGLTKAVIPEML